MITETGGGLTVVVMTTPEQDWQAFATWYSFHKNLPDARSLLVCLRNGKTPFALYQWAKRLKVPVLYRNPVGDSEALGWLHALRDVEADALLAVRPLVVAARLLDETFLDYAAKQDFYFSPELWYLRKGRSHPDRWIERLCLTDLPLPEAAVAFCAEAKECPEPAGFVSYRKGCGRWIHTATGCPFSSAGGLVTAEMTANEHKVVGLWQRMVPLYDAVT